MSVVSPSRFSSDGSWTASTGGAVCATGTAAARDGLVILDRVPVGPDLCMPHSLAVRDEQLWATFETSFKGRTVAAMIGLYRVGRRVAEAAEAADER